MSDPLPFQLVDFGSYVGDFGSVTYDFFPNSIHQRNPMHSLLHCTLNDFKFVAGPDVNVHVSAPYMRTGKTLIECLNFRALSDSRPKDVT